MILLSINVAERLQYLLLSASLAFVYHDLSSLVKTLLVEESLMIEHEGLWN
jgi:hypothetical protein